MVKKLSVLKIVSSALIVIGISFVINDYLEQDDEGWGGVWLMICIIHAAGGFIIDYILSRAIPQKMFLNLFEILVVAIWIVCITV